MPLFTHNMHIISFLGNASLNISIDNLWFVHRYLAKAIFFFFCIIIALKGCNHSEDLNWQYVDNFDIALISANQFCARWNLLLSRTSKMSRNKIVSSTVWLIQKCPKPYQNNISLTIDAYITLHASLRPLSTL